MVIDTNTKTILLDNVNTTYLITSTGDKIDLKNTKIEFEQTNEIFGSTYTNSVNWSKQIKVGDIKQVRKDKIDLTSKHAFYVSQGKINSWEKYISYDLYLTPNELEIVSVSEREKYMGSDQKHVYKVYHVKANNFSMDTFNMHGKVVSGEDKWDTNDRDIDTIEEVIERMKNSPLAYERKDKIAILENYIKQGKKYIVYYKRNEPLPQEFDLVVFDRVEYGKDYKRRDKLAKALNELLYNKHLSHYDIETLEKNGYKIVKTRK